MINSTAPERIMTLLEPELENTREDLLGAGGRWGMMATYQAVILNFSFANRKAATGEHTTGSPEMSDSSRERKKRGKGSAPGEDGGGCDETQQKTE